MKIQKSGRESRLISVYAPYPIDPITVLTQLIHYVKRTSTVHQPDQDQRNQENRGPICRKIVRSAARGFRGSLDLTIHFYSSKNTILTATTINDIIQTWKGFVDQRIKIKIIMV